MDYISKVFCSCGDAFPTFTNMNRTLARSRELEAEEQTGLRHSVQHDANHPFDEQAYQSTADGTDDDEIDFLDNEEPSKRYQDNFTDDADVFRDRDRDEENAFGLIRQPSRR